MSQSEPMRVAVLSLAHVHAASYLHELGGRPDVELLVHDPGPYEPGEERGRAFAERHGAAYVDTLEELLAWGPRAVVVASENSRHLELVTIAAEAGCDILCEKPLATTLEDAAAIRSVVADHDVRLMVAYPVRFAPSVQHVKSLVDDGSLGDFVSLRGSNNGKLPIQRRWFTDPELAGGGALIDHIVHVADVMDYFLEERPVAVSAVANRILYPEADRIETGGLVIVEYESGATAAIDCSWSQPLEAPPGPSVDFSVLGTAGTIDVSVWGPRLHGIDAAGRPLELLYGADFDGIMVDRFLEAVRSGATMTPGIESGIRSLQVVDAALRSARTGQRQAVRG